MNALDSRSIRAEQSILESVDRIAEENRLPELSSRLIARHAGMAEEVVLRHMRDVDAVLDAWLESRSNRLDKLIGDAPSGRLGLIRALRDLLHAPALLSLLFCQPMDAVGLRSRLEQVRTSAQRRILERVGSLDDTGSQELTKERFEQLWNRLECAWDRNDPQRDAAVRQLQERLPWEGDPKPANKLPEITLLKRLAVNESGFVFDPVSGSSYTTNETGSYLLGLFQKGKHPADVVQDVVERYDISVRDAERDVLDFISHLRETLK
ncbi:MAG: PqqD family protein [Magnetococcales bacterium]|nr:PqqD family protein [Magnetococcales bacterium]